MIKFSCYTPLPSKRSAIYCSRIFCQLLLTFPCPYPRYFSNKSMKLLICCCVLRVCVCVHVCRHTRRTEDNLQEPSTLRQSSLLAGTSQERLRCLTNESQRSKLVGKCLTAWSMAFCTSCKAILSHKWNWGRKKSSWYFGSAVAVCLIRKCVYLWGCHNTWSFNGRCEYSNNYYYLQPKVHHLVSSV